MKAEILSDYGQVGLSLLGQNCVLTRRQVNVKSLMKTSRVHITVIEPLQDMYTHHK